MKHLIICLTVLLFVLQAEEQPCVVTMGYKLESKPPYIFSDNSGIYADVYGGALKRIGCSLKIKRLPKLRIIEAMKEGKIDFYPTFAFTTERAAYTLFIPSHIDHKNVLVTRSEYPELTSIPQLLALNPVLLKERGGYSKLEGIPAKRFETTATNIDKNIALLVNKRIDAFSYPYRIITYYMKLHPDVAKKIRIHKHFFPPEHDVHTLGFSLFSPYCQVEINKSFDPLQPISVHNFPTHAAEGSVVKRFAQSLQEMDENGEIKKIYDQQKSVE